MTSSPATYIYIYISNIYIYCIYVYFFLWTTKDYQRHFACSIVDVGSTIQKLASHDLSVDMPSCLGIHHLKKSSCRLRPWVTRFCTPACRMMAWRREGGHFHHVPVGPSVFWAGMMEFSLAGSIDPNLRWRFQIDEVLTCWFFITISNWRSSEALLFWGEEFAEVSSLCAKHAQFYSKVIPSLVLPHDFPWFSYIFPRFCTRFP